ncbi:MAG: hypothetical protein ACE5F4_01715 [Candidatus Paceibacteria bacterium]
MTSDKLFKYAIGGGTVALFELLLIEWTFIAGGAYDLANGGYLSDFLETGHPSELLDLHELNFGEAFGSVAVVVSLAVLALGLRSRARFSGRELPA